MLDAKEIDIEIARLEYGESSYPAYAKLANLYTIRDMMQRNEKPSTVDQPQAVYSLSPPPGDSEFLRAVEGRDPDGVWEILDDLMDTLRVVNPRVYSSIMRKINSL